MKKIFISDKELNNYGETNTFSDKADSLLSHQKENWDLVEKNFRNLDSVKIINIDFDSFRFKIQFNPSRITSTSAKVDKKSIENRVCFLCKDNLPETQKGIKYQDDYVILINPFPVFKQHLTIPHIQHIPQKIDSTFKDMLQLSFDLKDNFFVFYNGPKCGASAPDHFHFQAGQKKSTPIENFYNGLLLNYGEEVYTNNITKIYSVNHSITKFIFFKSSDKNELVNLFNTILNVIKIQQGLASEPMINIFTFFDNSQWKVFLYLREKHRPKQYFANDDTQLLISPASVDLAGLCVTPREDDFNRVTKEDLKDICSQVLMNTDKFEKIIRNISKYLSDKNEKVRF